MIGFATVNARFREDFVAMTKSEVGKPTSFELKPDTKVTLTGRNPHAHGDS